MIEGIRLLPWAAAYAHLKQTKFWLNCSACKKNTSIRRERMRCGYIPHERWETADRVIEIADLRSGIINPSVCPGYSTQLPKVLEAARAWGHWERGQLQLRYADPPGELLDLIELFHQERSMAEAYVTNEATKQAR